MAVDTANKRYSMAGLGGVDVVLYPIPDGTVSEADRAHWLGLYNGFSIRPLELLKSISLSGRQAGYDVTGKQAALSLTGQA